MKFITSFLISLTFLLSLSIYAGENKDKGKDQLLPSNCPAAPDPIVITQSDNTTITILGKGDILNNWTETIDGYTVKLNQNGIYEYATMQNGALTNTGIKANDPSNRLTTEIAYVSALQKSIQPTLSPLKQSILSQVNSQIQNKTYPTTGSIRILALLIDYPDLTNTFVKSDFDSLLYGANFRNGDGSFKYYYETSSDSQIIVNVDVRGWFRATNGYLYYGRDSGTSRAADLVREAVDAAELAGVNFANYDNDNNNSVDGILAVHAGPGAEQGSRTQYIWSHRWVLNGGTSGSVIYDGVRINDYMINPETRIRGTAQNLVGIGVFCHEFGHNLGLPDLYDTDPNNGDSEGIGNWCLMAGGGWLGGEHRPINFSAWCRIENGWATTTNLTIGTSSNHTMNPSTTHRNDIFRINTINSNEYFLLENRQKSGLDLELPGEGLAVWHINTIKTNSFGNSVNADENLKGVDLEEADGNNDLDNEINRGDAGDLFPGTSLNNTFDDNSNPNAKTYTNVNTNLQLRNITETGSLVSFDFGPAPVATCSGLTTITNSSGSLDDGSGVNNYDNNLNCSWLIQPTGATSITLNFTAFDVDPTIDRVAIYDGIDFSAPLIGTYTGTTIPTNIVSTGGSMYIEFTTDASLTALGWNATYTSSSTSTPTCSGTTNLTSNSGTFNDGSGPNTNYSDNLNCSWLISPASVSTIQVVFDSLSLSAGDSIYVYDGSNNSAQLLGSYSGNNIPSFVTSSGNDVFVEFVTNSSINDEGWQISYNSFSSCSGLQTFTSAGGTFSDGTSPTLNYSNNLNCSWLIQPPGATFITLNWNRFFTEQNFDFVEVYDGINGSANLIGRYDGNTIPPNVTSTGGSLFVNFSTDGSQTFSGWEVTYSSTTNQCLPNATLIGNNGTFSDGSGANNYNNNLNCGWLIQPPFASSITLGFIAFDTEATNDVVNVYDGIDNTGTLVGSFSGSSIPINTTVNGTNKSLFVEFITNANTTASGWDATYSSTTSLSCSGNTTFTAASGSFDDGSGPIFNYDNNLNCNWLIQPTGTPSLITLNFTAMNIQFGDFVRIYDGTSNTGNFLGTRTGTNTGPPVNAFSGSMFVEFITNTNSTGPGWDATYNTSNTFCVPNQTLTNNFGTITDGSPFNGNYANNTNCEWLIQPTTPNVAVRLTFFNFDTELINDTVTIYDGTSTADPILGTFSGNSIPPTITSTGGDMLLTFKSNGSVTTTGWRASYGTQPIPFCSGTTSLTTNSGTFDDGSPSSQAYIQNSNCSWLIQPTGAARIALNFNRFATASADDSVTIYDGASTSDPILGQFFGANIPPTVTSSGGSMLVNFSTNNFQNSTGWEATYNSTTSQCFSNLPLTAFNDTIRDGSGNSNYANNLNCSWLIRPPTATSINLNFINFDLAGAGDSLRVYDGSTNVSPLLGSFGGTNLPPSISSTGGDMFIEFITDGANTASGWKAYYDITSSLSCIGTTNLTAPTGSFDDGSGGSNYDNNLNCGWLIQPSNNPAVISLTFNSMNTNSFFDRVRIYDGTNASGTFLGSLFGTNTGNSYSAFSGSMFVEFITDASGTAAGWDATYSTSSSFCVPNTTFTGNFGNFTDGSPFGSNYLDNTSCQWLIQPTAPNVAINLRFFAFDTEAGNDTVTIYDGATTSDPILATYSGNTNPPNTLSSGGNMLVTFKSNGNTTATGWRANYSTQVIPFCSGVTTLTNATGTFDDGSGNGPNYIANSNCSWLIQPPGAVSVDLSFNRFRTEANGDFVNIYDGIDNTGLLLGSYSGTSIPPSLIATSGSMFVEFLVDPFTEDNGWEATYTSSTVVILDAVEDTIYINAGAGSQSSLNVNSNTFWNVTDNAIWLIPTTINGQGNQSVNVVATQPNIGPERAAKVFINSTTGNNVDSVVVIQRSSGRFLVCNPDTLYFTDNPTASQSIAIAANVNWNLTPNSTWITTNVTSGSNNGSVNVTASQNTTNSVRNGFIVATGNLGASNDTIFIVQDTALIAAPGLSVSPNNLTLLQPMGSSSTFDVNSNVDWQTSKSQPWLDVINPPVTSDTGTVQISANTMNANPNSRTAYVAVQDVNGTLFDTVFVTQFGTNPILSGSPDTVFLANPLGSTGSVSVSSNTASWTAIEGDVWFSSSQNSGSGNISLGITTNSANPSSNRRFSYLALADPASLLTDTVIVVQEGTNFQLSVSPSSLNLNFSSGSNDIINVNSNINWSVTNPVSWLSLSANSGNGNSALSVTANSDNLTGSNRTATLTFSGSGVSSQIVTVTQIDGSSPSFEVSKDTVFIDNPQGSTGTFSVLTTENNWSLVEDTSWLLINPASGNGTQLITALVASRNVTGNVRYANITASVNNFPSKIVTIAQQASTPLFIVGPKDVILGPDSNDVASFNLSSNLVSWQVVENENWMMVSPDSGGFTRQILITATDSNRTNSQRVGTITITAPPMAPKTITVTQDTVRTIGINEINISDNSVLYPNPTDDFVTLELQGAEFNSQIKLNLYNSIGVNQPFDFTILSNEKILIDLSDKAAGIYFITLLQEESMISKRIILTD